MKVQPTTQQLIAMLYERLPELFDRPQRQSLRDVKPLTDERILHFVGTHIGGPSPSYPLDNSDWINFARAIEAAHGITKE